MRDYRVLSPSLEGVFIHDSVRYEGISRPVEILRALEGPASKRSVPEYDSKQRKVLDDYFRDLYAIFLKRLSTFAVESSQDESDGIRLQAMLQELVKIKTLIEAGKK